MTFSTLLAWLQGSTLATLIGSSRYIAMVIQIFHILAFTLLLGLVIAFNARLQGLALKLLPLPALAQALYRPYVWALAVALAAGALLALPRAATYANNTPFVWKMALLLGAGLLQAWLLRRALHQQQVQTSLALRSGAAVALVLWLGTGMAGRAIGFV